MNKDKMIDFAENLKKNITFEDDSSAENDIIDANQNNGNDSNSDVEDIANNNNPNGSDDSDVCDVIADTDEVGDRAGDNINPEMKDNN